MRLLGRILGDTVRKQSGETIFGTVEGITSNQILSSVFVTPSLPGATVSLSSATLSGGSTPSAPGAHGGLPAQVSCGDEVGRTAAIDVLSTDRGNSTRLGRPPSGALTAVFSIL